jgi:hypothetical protein
MNEPLASGTETAQVARGRCQRHEFDHAEGWFLRISARQAVDLTRAKRTLALGAAAVEEGGQRGSQKQKRLVSILDRRKPGFSPRMHRVFMDVEQRRNFAGGTARPI